MSKPAAVLSAALALPLAAQAQHFVAFLSGYQEVPSVSTPAEGVFQVHVSSDRSHFDYVLQYKNLQGTVQQAHIHFAQTAVNGPIVVWLCGTATNPGPAGTQPCPQQGTLNGSIGAAQVLASPPAQQLAAGEVDELVRAMRNGAAYVNVHTSLSPGGEIRGQVKAW